MNRISRIKHALKRVIHAFGYDLRKFNPSNNSALQLLVALERYNIDMIIDVGANTGQFSSELRSVGYKGNIISFEPLSDAHWELKKIAKRDSKWQVAKRAAIGNYDGEININISGNSVSSSVLPMMKAHSSAAEGSAYVDKEKVPVYKLDTVVPDYIEKYEHPFLKIDTQGFEWEVLNGASEILKRVKGILCEVSLVPLYKEQHLWLDMIDRIENEGFTIWSIQQGFRDQRDGRTLQLDITFFRV